MLLKQEDHRDTWAIEQKCHTLKQLKGLKSQENSYIQDSMTCDKAAGRHDTRSGKKHGTCHGRSHLSNCTQEKLVSTPVVLSFRKDMG